MSNQTSPNPGSNPGTQGKQTGPLDQYTNQPAPQKDDSPFYKSAAPSISLPKGGGALKGIDEKFSVNAVNGTANLDIPLPITPGRGGFTPSLSLSYSSGGGNSIFGLGWNLSLPSIQRRTDKKLPLYRDYEESDVFLLAGAEDLVPELDSSNNPVIVTSGAYTIKRYIPRIEGLFARIEYIKKAGVSGGWWRVTTKDNITTYYGLNSDGCIANPDHPERIFKWLPQITVDHKGNVQYFTYLQEDDWAIGNAVYEKNHRNGTMPYANTYLRSVAYCNETPYFIDPADAYEPALPTDVNFLMEAVLDYGDHSEFSSTGDLYWLSRSDPFSDFHAGFEIRTYRRCKRVMMFHYFSELNGHNLVRTLELQYQNDLVTPALPLTEADYIVSATQKGYEYKNDAWHSRSLPAMNFTYQALQWDNTVQRVQQEDFTHAPQGLTGPYQWIDFEGEGISGILTETAGSWFYKSNLGDGHFTNARSIAEKPSFDGFSDGSLQWADLDADGRRQVVTSQPVKGYFELNDDQQWQSFRTFPNNINIDWSSPFTKMLDLNGDGKADAIVTEDQAWIWYENEGKEGWEQGGYAPVFMDEEKGPVLVLRDPVQCIFLADMNGDGMTDLVRIKNGEVCYWPNMGYGKFGAKVMMANAPRFAPSDLYDPKFLTLADISGTGAADLIYIGTGSCKAWINLSGNGWSEAQVISPLPGTDQFSKIAVLDFLGNGTGCIVWSSPLPQYASAPLRYIDLMGGNKPYLMNSYNNGMGKTVSVTYKSSTQFYLADKQAGIPWATKLPFPVHCISSITTHDEVSDTSYTQTYKYRHGYYDHEEREFRGFGYVETVDTDSALFFEQHDTNETTKNLDQFPVLTKTWFHTGAWMRETTLLEQFEKEYYPVNDWGTTPQVATFLWGQDQPTAQEQREAHRALKGSALRQEIYALDNTNLQAIPYTVAQTCYTVRRQQHLGANRYGSFFTWQQQALSWSIERKTPDNTGSHDARLQQSITLAVDDYGNVTENVQIAYPRKSAMTANAIIDGEQAKNHIIYNTTLYTNKVEDDSFYRLPLPYEQCSFELYVPVANFHQRIITSDDFTNDQNNGWLQIAQHCDFADVPDVNTVALRQLSCARSIYKKDDTTGYLTLGTLEALALPYKTYVLAFTLETINLVYDAPALLPDPVISYAMLDEAGYTENQYIDEFSGSSAPTQLVSAGDEWRWLPSGTTGYTAVTPAANFYQPDTYTDPKGNSTTVTYWPGYALLPQSTTDAIGNTATVLSYDWRCLQPAAMQDANLNISEICYDMLCMPVATAVKGKGTEADFLQDLNGNDLDPDSNDDTTAQHYFWMVPDSSNPQYGPEANAAQLLGRATWRCIYQLDYHTGEPTAIAMIGREDHYTQNSDSEVVIRITYTDGLGRIAMHKARVADGPLPVLEDNWQLSPPDRLPDEPDIDSPLADAARWVGSGKTVYNNKGKAVLQYEPYFSATPAYDPAQQAALCGVSPRMYYDPLGRMYHTDMPDGTWSYTTWDNWQQTVYDANDAVHNSEWESVRQAGSALGQEEVDAAVKTQAHSGTPTVMHLDTLARPFYTMAMSSNSSGFDIQSYAVLNVQGNRLKVVDGLGRDQLTYRYNMLQSPCRQESIDGGTTQTLVNFAGQPCCSLDAAQQLTHITYDSVQRLLTHELQTPDGSGGWRNPVLLSVMTYGETATPASGTIEDHNLRGRLVNTKDGSGMSYIDSYDFKGVPVLTNLQLLADKTKRDADWSQLSTADLDTEIFTTTVTIDALGRVITATDPGGNITRHSYDKGGALNGIYVTLAGASAETTYVQDIHYDAKGQRQSIWYGNGIKTRYTYDPLNYRLRRLLTVNLNPSPHVILQDLNYYYDAVGNITTIRNDALDTEYFNNNAIRPVFDYTYDALYRLIIASGREQAGASSYDTADNYQDYTNIIKPLDTKSPQTYTQYYSYDAVGNILRLRHSSYNGYTRCFNYDSATSNRLVSTHADIGPSAYNYTHDVRGNITAMPHLSEMDWDCSNQLCYITDGTTPTYYQYSSGQRTRKYTDKGSVTEERIYLGNFEIYRKFDSSSSLILIERTTLHISDDTGRIAMIETRTIGDDGSAQQLQRYIYSDHLGSSTLELDENAKTISYEEYHPYGTTAWQESNADINAVAKRYRYTGKERDNESGLYYHGARYYIPWLCRWTAVDPAESKYAGMSPYNYCFNNPIMHNDQNGADPGSERGSIYKQWGHYTWAPGINSEEEFKHSKLYIDDKVTPYIGPGTASSQSLSDSNNGIHHYHLDDNADVTIVDKHTDSQTGERVAGSDTYLKASEKHEAIAANDTTGKAIAHGITAKVHFHSRQHQSLAHHQSAGHVSPDRGHGQIPTTGRIPEVGTNAHPQSKAPAPATGFHFPANLKELQADRSSLWKEYGVKIDKWLNSIGDGIENVMNSINLLKRISKQLSKISGKVGEMAKKVFEKIEHLEGTKLFKKTELVSNIISFAKPLNKILLRDSTAEQFGEDFKEAAKAYVEMEIPIVPLVEWIWKKIHGGE